MNGTAISRPVVAFALLKECSEVLRTDLLGGIALLIKPLISDLGGQRFSAEVIRERLSENYGISISVQALTDFIPRFLDAGILEERKVNETVSEAVYVEIDQAESVATESDEIGFQFIFDRFLGFCDQHLSSVGVTISKDQLISGLLTRLATFDFRAIEVKPDRTAKDASKSGTILGPTAKEDRDIEDLVVSESKLDVLVASFVNDVCASDQTALELLVKVAEGALGAELVFDLQAPQITSDLSKVTIILDSPILLSLLDLSDQQHRRYANDLVQQIRRSGATVAAFRHSIEEAEGVLGAVKTNAHFGNAYGPTAERMRDRAYVAFFETMVGAVEARLIDQGIKIIEPTGAAQQKYFVAALEDELTSRLRFHLLEKRLARERDARSLAEVIRLRAGVSVSMDKVQACRYLFVTSNLKLQEQTRAFLMNKGLLDRSEFPPVISDRYFSGLAWLMFGGESDISLTTAKLLANCSTALRARPDIIAKTRAFLARIDPQKAAHFEALMTRERAARYLTEITLGDSLLITAENAEEIYERVEEIAGEKIARAKDAYYSERLAEKDGQLVILRDELGAAKTAIQKLEGDHSKAVSELAFHSDHVAFLGKKLQEEERLRVEGERRAAAIQEQLKQIENIARRAESDALRAKKSAILLALRDAKLALWSFRILVLALFVVSGFYLGYVDRFILPRLEEEWQASASVAILVGQVFLASVGFWVFTDHLFGPLARRFSIGAYNKRVRSLGYESVEPEFDVDLRALTVRHRSDFMGAADVSSVKGDC